MTTIPDRRAARLICDAAGLLQRMFAADTDWAELHTYLGPSDRPRHDIHMVAQEIVDIVLSDDEPQPVAVGPELRRAMIASVMRGTGDEPLAESIVDHLVAAFPHIGDPHGTITYVRDADAGPSGVTLPPDGPALWYVAGGPPPDGDEPTLVRLDAADIATLADLGIRTRALIRALASTSEQLLARSETALAVAPFDLTGYLPDCGGR